MLNERQKEVAQALYEGRYSEAEVIEQFNLRPQLLRRWLVAPDFQKELQRLCEVSARETRFTICRYGPIAALRLAELIGSEKDDTARRAALDMIDRCLRVEDTVLTGDANQTEPESAHITDEQAQHMLLTLAEGLKQQSG